MSAAPSEYSNAAGEIDRADADPQKIEGVAMQQALLSGGCGHDVISAIYAGINADDSWTPALSLLCKTLDANGAGLRISHKGRNPQEYICAAGPDGESKPTGEWEALNAWEWLPWNLAIGEARIIDLNEVDKSPRLAELARREAMGMSLAMCVDKMGPTAYILSCARPSGAASFDADEFAFFQSIGRHFSRAIKLRRQLLHTKVVQEFQAEALDRLGIAGVLIDRDGSELPLNDMAKTLIDSRDGVKSVAGRIHAADDTIDRSFQTAIRSALATQNASYSSAMRLPRCNGGLDLSVVINGCSSISILSNRVESMALMFIRDPDVSSDADMAVLQQLFSFTRAEAKLAIGLAKGMKLDAIENKLNIRHNTARSHLRSMFVKTAVTRRAELVHLLANCVTPLGGGLGTCR